jgi:hypothetical protein
MKAFPMIAALILGGLAHGADRKASSAHPPGEDKKTDTELLKVGAQALQRKPPVSKFDFYLVGFHPMKGDPQMQMEAHHFCNQVNEEFMQCVLFDGNGGDANMNGVEYIISEKLFEGLPEEEKAYWHPHNYEILSGQLIAPGIPEVAEKAAMKKKMNSYGKTWHFWMTHEGAHALPMGPPHLAWSFNRDGEAKPGLVEKRDRAMKIDSNEERKSRSELTALARPQQGVNDLKAAFPSAKGAPDGVSGKGKLGGVPHCEMKAPAKPASD